MNQGIIYLSGGGDYGKTVVLDSHFLKNLAVKNILFIPIAKSGDMNGYKKSLSWVVDKLSKLTEDPINVTLAVNLYDFEDLSNFSAVYIGGGNTYKLLQQMHESGFLLILKKYIQNGGIIYGASAGAVLMGKQICTYIEEKYLLENKKYGYNLKGGLGLIGNYSILTHFNEDKEKENEQYFESNTNPIIAIPEGVAVVVRGGICEIVGDKAITLMEKTSSCKIGPNTTFML